MPARRQRVRLTPRAEADLEIIWKYTFETWSAKQADHYVMLIMAAAEAAAAGEKSSQPVDVKPGYSKCLSGSHVIYFKKNKTGIDVIRILHQRMDAERHLYRET